jgi:site-specific recombinase XerD
MFSVLIFTRQSQGENVGKSLLYLRFIYERKVVNVTTGIKISTKNWNHKAQLVTGFEPCCTEINLTLQTMKTNCLKLYLDCKQNDSYFSLNKVLDIYAKKKKTLFLEFALQHIPTRESNEITKRSMRMAAECFDKFCPNCTLQAIDSKLMNEYKIYLKTVRNQQHNTIVSNFRRLKAIFNAAAKLKIIKENPYKDVVVGDFKAKQLFLSIDELELISNSYDKIANSFTEKSVLSSFLFACYTGLRHSDIVQLDYNMIKTYKQQYYIEICQHKTNDIVNVPLSNYALKYLDLSLKNCKVFKGYTTQSFNRTLKIILAKIDIKKNVTSHVARHTFITQCMQKGMRKEFVGKVAGHKKSSTTDGYTHLQLDDLFNEMQKWN